jgi:hypothetical protein
MAGIEELTVIRHLLCGVLPPKDKVLVPGAVAKLTIVGQTKGGGKFRQWMGQHMELDIEKQGKGPNRAQLHQAMAKGAMFIHTSMLVCLCIVSKGRKDLLTIKT